MQIELSNDEIEKISNALKRMSRERLMSKARVMIKQSDLTDGDILNAGDDIRLANRILGNAQKQNADYKNLENVQKPKGE